MSKKILWGILLLILSVGLIAFAFFPDYFIDISPYFDFPLWKWFIGIFLIYLIFDRLITAKKFVRHFDFFIPLALLFMVFEKEIAKIAGLPSDFVNNWLILGISIMLTVAFHLIFGGIKKKKKHNRIDVNYQNNNYNSSAQNNTFHCDFNECKTTNNTLKYKTITYEKNLGNGIVTFDMAECYNVIKITNNVGQLDIYFKNTDSVPERFSVDLNIDYNIGEVIIHIPKEWNFKNNLTTSIGIINDKTSGFSRDNSDRVLKLNGTKNIGEIIVVD